MRELIDSYLPQLLWLAGGLSLVTPVATLVAVPWVVGRLPADYFHHDRRLPLRPAPGRGEILLALAKNVLGALLLALGVVMLFLPGQGLLTMLAGLLLMNFPGKYRLERAVVSLPKVLEGLNWIRARRGREPFVNPDAD